MSVAHEGARRFRLTHVFPSFDIGGVQTRFAEIVNRLPPGFEHRVLALDGNLAARERVGAHVDLVFEATPETARGLPARLGAYRRWLRNRQPDLLLTYNWGSIEFSLANLTLGIPHIHGEDGFGPAESEKQLPRRVWTRRLALRRSLVVVPSLVLQDLARRTWWVPDARLHLLRNGIDLQRYRPGGRHEARQALGLADDMFVVGWTGALRPEKNVPRLLRAVADLPSSTRVVLVGDGGERSRLEQTARDCGLAGRALFLGMRSDVAALLPAFDVLALSSDTEQMPVVVIEAMAAGLPIASVDVGDVKNMVGESNRAFITDRSEQALAGALLKLAHDPAARESLGRENRALAAERYDMQRMVESYRALYERTAQPASA
ncbi:MAG: glycosyltransferase [Alphaproteobacteria bacterium]|nr:glycosyltransferase [Alphaproteobacteria bacterium]